jgi:hypothetical protein
MLGAGIAVLCIFLPGMLLAVGDGPPGTTPPNLRAYGRARAGQRRRRGILAAALYNPVLLASLPQ